MFEMETIEHRLFSQISRNWAGVPLRTWETLLAFIRGTRTTTGLAVHATPLSAASGGQAHAAKEPCPEVY
jgi:hypothetical protein